MDMDFKQLHEHILKADDCKRVKVHVPEWGCDVYVKALTAKEQDDFEEKRTKNGKEQLVGMRARFVANCLVDANGNKIFAEKDIEKLSEKCGAVLNRLIDACAELNVVTQADLEVMAKN